MRIIILFTVALCIGCSVSAQKSALDKFYEKHKDADLTGDATLSLNGESLMNSIIKPAPGADNDALRKKVKKIRLLVFNDEKSPAATEWADLTKSLRGDHFEDLMSVHKGPDGVTILSADLKGGLKEIIFIGRGDGAFLLDITGSFNDKDLSTIKVQ